MERSEHKMYGRIYPERGSDSDRAEGSKNRFLDSAFQASLGMTDNRFPLSRE